MTEALGPPPRDLNERELPIVSLEGPWLRLHAAGREPGYFGRTSLNRFDDPEGEFGVLYSAEDAFGAFIEVYGRDPGFCGNDVCGEFCQPPSQTRYSRDVLGINGY
ncbi:MAG: hypothetical protein H0U55_07350 [Rubrobacteraceae bacterium]|nr:hypothetical protein [Rubrobacteraceae bacterium]